MTFIGSMFLGACIFGGLYALGTEIRSGLVQAAQIAARAREKNVDKE